MGHRALNDLHARTGWKTRAGAQSATFCAAVRLSSTACRMTSLDSARRNKERATGCAAVPLSSTACRMTPLDWAPFNIARRADARERRRAVCLSVSQRQIPGAAVSRPCDVAQYRWEGRAPLGASAGGRVHLSSHWVRDYLDSRVGLEWSAAGQHDVFAYARLCKTARPCTVPGQGWSGAPLVS